LHFYSISPMDCRQYQLQKIQIQKLSSQVEKQIFLALFSMDQ